MSSSSSDAFSGEQSSSSSGSSNGDSYSVDEFYTASRNKKGFGTTIRITVPPEFLGEISALVASRQIAAYRTVPDFVRDALTHRLKYLQTQIQDGTDFSISKLATSLILEDRIARQKRLLESNRRAVADLREVFNLAVTEDEREQALTLARGIRETATSLSLIQEIDSLLTRQ